MHFVIVRVPKSWICSSFLCNESKYIDASFHGEYRADHLCRSEIVEGYSRESCFGAIKIKMVRAYLQIAEDVSSVQKVVNGFICDLMSIGRDGKGGSESFIIRFSSLTFSEFFCIGALYARNDESCADCNERCNGLHPTRTITCAESTTRLVDSFRQAGHHEHKNKNRYYGDNADSYVFTNHFQYGFLDDEGLKHNRTYQNAIKTESP